MSLRAGRYWGLAGVLIACLLAGAAAQAHVASNGFLTVQVSDHTLTGSLEIAVRDLELAVGLDADGDGKVTWGELSAAAPRIRAYVAQHLQLDGDERPAAEQVAVEIAAAGGRAVASTA